MLGCWVGLCCYVGCYVVMLGWVVELIYHNIFVFNYYNMNDNVNDNVNDNMNDNVNDNVNDKSDAIEKTEKTEKTKKPRKTLVKQSSSMEMVPLDNTIILESWMEDNYVDHALVFDSLNVVPATHNSGAIHTNNLKHCIPWGWAKCQGYSIYEQLNMGIRCFDLRLKLVRDGSNNSHYQIVHFFESAYSLDVVMSEIAIFLNDNRKETVFIMIKPDWNTRANWRFNDLDVMWKKLYNRDFVLKNKDCYLDSEKILLNDLRFKNVRGKAIIMPDGHFYHSYKNIAKKNNKVNKGLDIDTIHGVKIVYPNFLVRCENWNAGSVSSAKRRIESFLMDYKERNIGGCRIVKDDDGDGDGGQGSSCGGVGGGQDEVLEHLVFPLIETNVLLWKGVIPPYFACKFMHSYLKNDCVKKNSKSNHSICYVKRMGFVLLDFANPTLVRGLLSNNRCSYW